MGIYHDKTGGSWMGVGMCQWISAGQLNGLIAPWPNIEGWPAMHDGGRMRWESDRATVVGCVVVMARGC